MANSIRVYLDAVSQWRIKLNIGKKLLILAGLLVMPQTASANAGVPMIALVMPAFVLSLIPIIIIEALYLSFRLHLPKRMAGKTAAISNIVSTLVGIPLTWFLLVAIQMVTGGGTSHGIETPLDKVLAVTWQSPWLIPYESELHWMVPVAGLILLVPFFFVSWWSEYLVTRKLIPRIDRSAIKTQVRNANLITYALLTLWPVCMLIAPTG